MHRSHVRTLLVLLAVGSFAMAVWIPMSAPPDTSDTGGGAMGTAIGMIVSYLLGFLLLSAGSLLPGDDPSRLPTIPALGHRQRYLSGVGVAVVVGGVVGNLLLAAPMLMYRGFALGSLVFIAVWLHRCLQGVYERLPWNPLD